MSNARGVQLGYSIVFGVGSMPDHGRPDLLTAIIAPPRCRVFAVWEKIRKPADDIRFVWCLA